MKSSKIILGTANFMKPYGVFKADTNRLHGEITNILKLALDYRVGYIDTAVNYGNVISMLKNFSDFKKFKIINKIKINKEYLKRINFENIDTVLMHIDPTNKVDCDMINEIMFYIKNKFFNIKLGVSIYNDDDVPDQIYDLCDVVQLPLSVLDRSLLDSGFIQYLKNKNIEVHARSIFLQGLLINQHGYLNGNLQKLSSAIEGFHRYCFEIGISPVEACLSFVAANKLIDHCVCGFNSLSELAHLLEIESLDRTLISSFPTFYVSDINLLKPYNWAS